MQTQVKYPLTEGAKQAAKTLVEIWDKNPQEQLWSYMGMRAGGSISRERINSLHSDQSIPMGIQTLRELSTFGLIRIDANEILLLQELRNAVENDFAVSDYFLTFNAVGNIFMMAENSTVSNVVGGASNFGDVTQTQTVGADIANELTDKLG